MDDLPVTIRLLDPPLQEFLPDLPQLVAAEAMGKLDDEGQLLIAAVRRLHQVNPMIGTRGVRLGAVRMPAMDANCQVTQFTIAPP